MREIDNLTLKRSRRSRAVSSDRTRRLGPDQPARFWPGPGRAAISSNARRAILILVISTAGCGGATAPCPTPTTELDRLRNESERLEQDLERATREERALSGQREEAGRRIAAAQAALDS
ncbi:MAG TPA: hypothetical protein VER77_06735, partial [Candidatus Dormibacteraeota bacterium]|nr:hypothetical protein [Candidatus Dormibacteraeota bacterium]